MDLANIANNTFIFSFGVFGFYKNAALRCAEYRVE